MANPDYIHFGNLEFLDAVFDAYTKDPNSVPNSFKYFFDGMQCAELQKNVVKKDDEFYQNLRIFHLIATYRLFGHLQADVNPIAVNKPQIEALKLEKLGFKQEELKIEFSTMGLLPQEKAPLEHIIERLQKIYCGSVGIEYCCSERIEICTWLQKKIEAGKLHPKFSTAEKKHILKMLNKATLFEIFLHTKYVGQKRFSLEGGETLIPMLHEMIEKGSQLGVEEFVIGMSHRGRLNILSNILNKSHRLIFSEFEDYYDPSSMTGSGDVKYHKGFSADIQTRQGRSVHVTLPANPSHLESIDPVLEGKVFAKQVLRNDQEKRKIVPILIHGDAAFSGQGVVYETLQMARLKGYSTGGTIHIIINNQIGFTTLPKHSRSTHYATDLAKAFSAPIFHLNAEDPEGCVAAMDLAMQIRDTFHSDVCIDLNCYRKYGHNEGDEPFFTQPLEYELIRKKVSIRELYRDRLIQEGSVDRYIAEQLEEEFQKNLHAELEESKALKMFTPDEAFAGIWEDYKEGIGIDIFQKVETGIKSSLLEALTESFCHFPSDFTIHPKIKKVFQDRLAMISQEKTVDWATAEYLAFATLLNEGTSVRLAGQDSRRGTFSHRHAVVIDQKTGQDYYPLQRVQKHQARFEVYDSLLSEYAALGFVFGYSLSYPSSLVIWEAQYGDFANGGQIVMDQYISSSEEKWQRHSGLTLLLPHGYEGQGPEHSSARMERYLQLTANCNIQVVYPTTPAQYFHLLRRQMVRLLRKPLIVFTPKSLLRHSLCQSPFLQFTKGSFCEILDDFSVHSEEVTRLLFCTGKVYYTLFEEREKRKDKSIAIIRIEQLYPFHSQLMEDILHKYANVKDYMWVQEEPKNMGAWQFIFPYLSSLISKGFGYAGRTSRAAPSVGSHGASLKEEKDFLKVAFEEIT